MHYWDVKQDHPATPAEAELDREYARLVAGTDLAARMEPWKQIVRTLNDECFVIWLPTQRMMLPVRNRFGNIHPTVIPHRVLWNVDRVFVKPPSPRA